ncbi:hypothetical protein [Clostridium sp. ZBS2]|uniref:hypothetical protein n=1 Tax=Clostridium sp. ZBS2 TaxID=2949976 RepID=UPI00207A1DD5|nr:hypothetical protein [Clostridium sp. ZBS2]
MKEIFNKIDEIILNNKEVNVENNIRQINLIENKLNIKLPEVLKNFYIQYNKNQNMLTAFYIFKNLEELEIEKDFLIIGYSNEYVEKYGIYVNDLERECINVKVAIYNDYTSNWLDYEELSSFIANCIVFQTINLLDASAVLDAQEIILEEYFKPLCTTKSKENKRLSYVSNDGNILAVYFAHENIIYFGATTDEILNKFEEQTEIDLDWL